MPTLIGNVIKEEPPSLIRPLLYVYHAREQALMVVILPSKIAFFRTGKRQFCFY